MKTRALLTAITVLGCFATPVFAGGDSEPGDETKIKVSGYSGFQAVRLMSYKWFGDYQSPRFYNNIFIDIIADCKITPHYSVHACVEGFMWFNTHPLVTGKFGLFQPALGENSAYVHQAEAVYSFDESNFLNIPDNILKGEFHLGYFPYKYNQDARNLGEYMFRSGTYPGWLMNIPFFPEVRLAGLLMRSTAFNIWKNDIMVTTEMAMYPFYDLSYTWISGINLGKTLDISAGVDLARFTPANSELTTREKDQNSNICPFYMKNLVTGAVGDTISGDTMFYTFTGIKAMGRFSFDFKGLLPADIAAVFGENDGKIYGEVDILGLVNQGDYYNKLSERIPVMFGFNVPTFKLLDVLSCEFEYYTNPYPNNYRNQVMAMLTRVGGTPVPDNQNDYSNGFCMPGWGPDNNWSWYQHDSWKWSVYVKKTMGRHFALIGLAARDHLRNMSNSLMARDFDESLTTNRQWYWAVRAMSSW